MVAVYTVVLGLLMALPLLGSVFFPYLWLDLVFLFTLVRVGHRCHQYAQCEPPFTLLDIFFTQVQKHPKRPLILFGEEVHSYGEIDRRSSQAARAFRDSVGLKDGDTVAVFLKNSPTYVWVWMGLLKIGCVMACINYNIRSKSLLHVLTSCKAKVVLTTPDFQAAIEDVLPTLKSEGIQVFYLSDDSPTEGVEALLGKIKSSSAEPVPASFRASITLQSTCLYIFTSGTTGLPKAAVISHRKMLFLSNLFLLCGIHAKDIFYTPLPLYHSAALSGLAGCIDQGTTCVLTPKFSVTTYWDVCRRHRVSVIQYIGEIMRYLCNAPKKDNDCDHGVRMAIGNGMKVEVWKEFLHRFGPIQVIEMYGSTEGNNGLVNYTGKVGAVGRTNFLHKKMTQFELLQYDIEKDQPLRNKKGLCIPVATGEAGLMVIKITASSPFNGYAGDRQKTEKKILRDVLKKGDCYFNTGDLLMQDHEGFMYFQDRVGDTFRWKGENVATTEVETTLATLDFIQEVNVYGVPVPGHEGKIGMAAIRLKEGIPFDGEKVYVHAKEYLPNYAIPRFIRTQDVLEITGTFKQIKAQLVQEGFDPTIISEPLYFLDDSKKSYVPMTQQIFQSIVENKLKM